MAQHFLIFILSLAITSQTFASTPYKNQELTSILIAPEQSEIELRITANGEIEMYEVPAEKSPPLSAIEGHEAPIVEYLEWKEAASYPVEPAGRRLSKEEQSDTLNNLKNSMIEKIKPLALSFCESSVRPETVGGTSGWSAFISFTVDATWNVDDLCAEESQTSSDTLP